MKRPWATRLLGHRLRQPDARSCGACALVVARAVADEGYAEFLVTGTHPVTGFRADGSVVERFHSETLGMHRRVTGLADIAGRLQTPWPRPLGTPPWALARQLSTKDARYVVRQALWQRRDLVADVVASLECRQPVALYVGSRWVPRHVMLAIRPEPTGGFSCYDPGSGQLRPVTSELFLDGDLGLNNWRYLWLAVLPERGAAAPSLKWPPAH
jgi:hypothetical protein